MAKCNAHTCPDVRNLKRVMILRRLSEFITSVVQRELPVADFQSCQGDTIHAIDKAIKTMVNPNSIAAMGKSYLVRTHAIAGKMALKVQCAKPLSRKATVWAESGGCLLNL